MFTAAFVTIARKWKGPSWSSADEWLMEMHIHMDWCSAVKRSNHENCREMDGPRKDYIEWSNPDSTKHVHSLESIAPSFKSSDISVATTPHQRSISLHQMSTITENHTGHNAESNRLGLGEASPEWMHLHHSSYIYGSGNTAEEKVACKSQNTRMSIVKESLQETVT